VIDTWDAINEAVIMPVFRNGDNAITRLALARGRIFMVRLAFDEARAANPAAVLVLNEFDLSSAYECLIEGVLQAGIPIDRWAYEGSSVTTRFPWTGSPPRSRSPPMNRPCR